MMEMNKQRCRAAKNKNIESNLLLRWISNFKMWPVNIKNSNLPIVSFTKGQELFLNRLFLQTR